MMSLSVLVVAPTPRLAADLMKWLTEAGCAVMLVTSFAAAKARLEQHPSLLLSEVRLGDYNGLHLALRAKAMGIPAIVLGSADAVLEREAERLGVKYRADALDRVQVADVVQAIGHSLEGRPASSSARQGLTFKSWEDLVPPVNARSESLAHPRRPLGS
jgi:CheY-like chemotaxis protein